MKYIGLYLILALSSSLTFYMAVQGQPVVIKEGHLEYNLSDLGKDHYNTVVKETEWVVLTSLEEVISFIEHLIGRYESLMQQYKVSPKAITLEQAQELHKKLNKARETAFSFLSRGTDVSEYKNAVTEKVEEASRKAGISTHGFYKELGLTGAERFEEIERALDERNKQEGQKSEATRQLDYLLRNPFQALEYWYFVNSKLDELVLTEEEKDKLDKLTNKLMVAGAELGSIINQLKKQAN